MALIPIDRFARRCRLSEHRLRRYEDLDLLTPPEAGPCYRPEQARDALVITLLQRLDVPLPDIAKVLDGDLAGPLLALRERLENEVRPQQILMRSTEKLLARGLPRPEITLDRVPERRLRVVRASADPHNLGGAFAACATRLAAAFEREGVPWRPPLLGLYPLDLAAEPLSIAAAIEADEEPPTTEAASLLAGTEATVEHIGPYEDLVLTYHALLTWVQDNGYEPSGPVVETYLTDPDKTAPEELVTRIGVIVQEG